MYERLAAPQASRGCLDPVTLNAIDQACRQLTPLPQLDDQSKQPSEELRDLTRNSLQEADERLAERLWQGEDVDQLVRARAWVVEQLLLMVWHRSVVNLEDMCLVAVGGFGRGVLHPHSDVDLLILRSDDQLEEHSNAALENFIQLLWDAGFYLGHSVRTVSQCVEESLADVSTVTTLIESRLLDGPVELYEQLQSALSPEQMWPADQFFEAKFAEQQQRHARFHDTAYNLEPNIKEGPGGLRDIQMIAWVARRHFGANTLHGLVEYNFLTESEYSDLVSNQRWLWRVRYALHLLAGRAEDRLLFDYQSEVAQRLGFTDQQNNLAVEQFMQSYYRAVMRLERLNERLLQLFSEELLFDIDEPVQAIGEEFQISHGFLAARDDAVFLRRPAALMEMFLLLAEHENLRGVTASTVRLVVDNLYLVDDAFRQDDDVKAAFLALLRQAEGVYTQLQRMNRYGLLAALIPVFGHIVGRMQYDLFHVYTVDQHTLFVVRNLRRFAYGTYRDRFPNCQAVFRRIERPELLYLAAIFHDIAKGRGGDHSELGAEDARVFCSGLDLDSADVDLIVWLVRQHLLMSRTAQRKDLTDPATIQEFAGIVGTTRYLNYLYLLTVADIAATSPQLWNSWKNGLLWDLYMQCGAALRRGLENPIKRAMAIRETRSRVLSRLLRRGLDAEAIRELWKTLPEHAFLRLSADQLQWTSQVLLADEHQNQNGQHQNGQNRGGQGQVLIVVRGVQPHGVSELLVSVPDHDGLFADITSVLDEMGMNVMAARILTTSDGRSFDLFKLMDHRDHVLSQQDAAELVMRLKQTAMTEDSRPLLQRPLPRRLRHFATDTRISFVDDTEQGGTTMEIECNDIPGLLSRVAAAMSQQGVQVHDARIATFGERVEDTFLVSDMHGGPLDPALRQSLETSIKQFLEGE
jgi:[protein-PII] uridylyltransferase